MCFSAAADHDADVYRALYRWDLQLDPAADLEANTAVIGRARKTVEDSTEPPLDNDGIPTRDQLLEAIAATPGSHHQAASLDS